MKLRDSAIFSAVRDERLAKLRHVDVALDSARDAGAGTAYDIDVSGDALYIDANPLDGNARMFIQTAGNEAGEVPLYVSPGAIFNVPFTRIRIENDAQAGKKLRIVYGVGVDFQPGSVAQLSLAGDVALDAATIREVKIARYGAVYSSTTAMAANTPDTIVTPAANVNGVIIHRARFLTGGPLTFPTAAFIAKTGAAPATVLEGSAICTADNTSSTNVTGGYAGGRIDDDIFIPAAHGIYFLSTTTESAAHRSMLYTVL